MQATEAHLGGEQRVQLRLGGEDARKMDGVLSRCPPSFYRKALRHLGNAADAEDAVQDALLSVYKHLDQFKGRPQLSTWLTAIVANSARMQLRRPARQMHVSLDERCRPEQDYSILERMVDRGPSPEDEWRKSELHEHIMQLLTQLSPPLRQAFQLCDSDGLTAREAAHILGVADGTVKVQRARARAKLRRLMRRALDPQPRSALSGTPLPVVTRKPATGPGTCVASAARLRDGGALPRRGALCEQIPV